MYGVDEQLLNYSRQHKPRLLQLLRSIGLDVEFHRSGGDFLYYLDEHQCEVEVLDLLVQGSTNEEIASQLMISKHTVARHRENIMRKLNLHNRSELVKYAIRKGLIEP